MSPKFAAVIGAVLALPFLVLFSLLILHIEPNFGPLTPLLNSPDPDQPNVIGSLVALSTLLLALAALALNLTPIMRTLRTGGGITDHPINLVLTITVLTFVTGVMGAIVIDQYPCWTGVPNCD